VPALSDLLRVSFVVIGRPQPAGSKRAFPVVRKTGIGVAVTDDNPKARSWKGDVAAQAAAAMRMRGGELLAGPLGLAVTFTLARPKGHFGTGRNAGTIRESAPFYPTVKPDCTKLLRAVEDACTGVVWRDDAQVVEQSVTKRYGEPESAAVVVWKL